MCEKVKITPSVVAAGALSSLSSMRTAKDNSSSNLGMRLRDATRRSEAKLTTTPDLSQLRFYHAEFDQEGTEVLRQGARRHRLLHTVDV